MNRAVMSKSTVFLYAAACLLILAAYLTPQECQAFDISVNVSPNIINLDSDDHDFGIHTNIPYYEVNTDTVIMVCPDLNELLPTVCYADSWGNLVAKFSTADLVAYCDLDVGGDNEFILEGETKIDPEIFSGSDMVLIIEKQPMRQNGAGGQNNQQRKRLNQ